MAREHSGVALVVAGIEAYEEAEAIERTRLLETARGGRPQVQHDVGRAVDLKLRGTAYKVTVYRTGPARFRVSVAEPTGQVMTVEADLERIAPFASRVTVGGQYVPARHRVARAGAARRGRRCHAPGQSRRGRHTAFSRTGTRRRHAGRSGRRGRRRGAGARAREHEDGDRPPGTVRGTGQGAPRRGRQPGRDGRGPGPARAHRRGPSRPPARRPPTPPTSSCRPTSPTATSPSGPIRARADLSAMLLGYDLDPGHETRTLAGYLAARDELAAAGASPVTDEMDLLDGLRRLRRAEPQPAGRRGGPHREPRAQPARALPHLPADARPRAGRPARRLRRAARAGAGPLRRHRCRAHRGARGGRVPGLPGPAALRTRGVDGDLDPAALAGRAGPGGRVARRPPASCSTGWCRPPSCASPSSATSRAASGSAGSTSRSSTPTVRRCSGPWATSSSRSTACPRATSAPRGSTRWPPSRSGSSRFLGARLRLGVPAREPMLAVLIKRHYREYALHDLHELTVDGRAVATADYRLDERASHLVSTVGRIDELAADSHLSRLLADQVADRPADHQAVVDLYLHWPDLPVDQEEASTFLSEQLARMPFAAQVRRVAVGVVPDDEREVGYFTFRPQAGRLDGRGPRGARRAPDGRPSAQPVAAARLRAHPARGPRGRPAAARRRRRQPAGPAPRGPGPGAPARRRARRGRQGHRAAAHRACPGQLPRGDPPRPRHARRRRPARHQPRLAAHLAAGRGRPRPADRAAGQGRPDDGRCRHRGGAHRGRDRGRERPHRPDLRPLLVPARVGGHLHRRPAGDHQGRARSTATPRRSSAPGGAAWSTPTSWSRWSPAPGARSRSSTSTRRVGSCRSTAPTARTPPA